MERRFDYDFGAVRVHTDSQAAQSAEALTAKAFTLGQHIVFGEGLFTPDTYEGKRLLAHELAHVVQQSRGGAPPALDPTAHHERAAANAAAHAMRSTGPIPVQGGTAQGIAREQEDWDIRVIPDPGAGKVRVVRVDKRGRILAGLAEITPPKGAALDPNQVVASSPRDTGPDAGKPVVTIPEEWQTTTNPKQKVVVQKSSEAVAFGEDTIMPEGQEERKRERDDALAFVEERPWDVLMPELYQWPNVVDDAAVKALRDTEAFKKWQAGKIWKEQRAVIDRQNAYYQQQLGMDLSPDEAREVWEQRHGPADATPWERNQREAGTLPNEIRDPATNEIIGYQTYETAEKYLMGGVGTVTEITLDREGKVVDRKETTALTPATEVIQEIVRQAPITGTLINTAEVGGLSLNLRDPGRFLTEGERIDRAVSAVPFGDLARTGVEASTGVSASDKDIDALLADQPRILTERERKGKFAMLVASGASAAVGGIRARVKLKGKGPKLSTPDITPPRPRTPAPAARARATPRVAPAAAGEPVLPRRAATMPTKAPVRPKSAAAPAPPQGNVKRIPPGARGKPHPTLKGEPGTRPVSRLSERRQQASKPPPSEPQTQPKPLAEEPAAPVAVGQTHGGEVPKAPHLRAVDNPPGRAVSIKRNQQRRAGSPVQGHPTAQTSPRAAKPAHDAPVRKAAKPSAAAPVRRAAKQSGAAPAASKPAAAKPQGRAGTTATGPARRKSKGPVSATRKTIKTHDVGTPEVMHRRSVTGPGPKVDPHAPRRLGEGIEAGQTYARTEKTIAPGVTRRSTTAAVQNEATRQIQQVSLPEIDQHVTAMNKSGVNFKFSSDRLARHAEVKQAIKRPNEPVSVTQRPCPSCVRFFKAEAKFQGKRQTIGDPDRTWVFEPDGSVWTKQH